MSISDERGDMSQSPEVLMDDLFVHVSDHESYMVVAYDPQTPVSLLGQAFELVVKRDMDVTDHYYDIDWGREVSVCTPRIPHG